MFAIIIHRNEGRDSIAPAAKYSLEEEERIVLQSAAQVIVESSVLDFKMSAIAARAGISVGSVYKHVQSKEDVMIALVAQSLRHSADNFRSILQLPLTTPERAMATLLPDLSLCGLYPFDEHLRMLVTHQAILAKGSVKWRERLLKLENDIEETFASFFERAFDAGELGGKDKNMTLDKLTFGLWALAEGFKKIELIKRNDRYPDKIRQDQCPNNPRSYQIQCVKDFINGFAWDRPLDDAGLVRVYQVLEQAGFRKHTTQISEPVA